MRRILVLRGGALGDFIVTLPALALLRRGWPDARIELVGNATAAQLGLNRGLLDVVHSQHEARWAALFGDAPLLPQFADWLGAFDLVVNYWPDPDGELARRFPLHAQQTFLCAAAMPTCAPAAAHYCEVLRKLGLETKDYRFRISPVATSVSEWNSPTPPLAHARGYSAIHPGSGSPRKNWPVEEWLKLIPELPAPVSIILGEAEIETWSRIRVPSSHELVLNRSLKDLVELLSHCRLFLGHDSGISHLAAGCGAPCVLLFGATDPAMWAPPAPNVQVLQRGPELNAISVEDVRRAVAAARVDQT